MQHADVFCRHNMHRISFNVPNFNEIWFKCQNPWVRQSKILRQSLPVDPPIRPCPPAVSVDEKGEFTIIEQELSVQPLDMYWSNIFFPCNKVQGGICLV